MANPESDQAFASFEQKWLVANPEQVMVGLFIAPSVRLRAVAFGCLVHELSVAADEIHETEVAAAKLAWWAQELEVAATGHARHPITHALFDDVAPEVRQRITRGAFEELFPHVSAPPA